MKQKAQNLAKELFRGVTDKSGAPYIKHCEEVALKSEKLAKDLGLSETKQEFYYVCGVLHDVLEDTSYTKEEILKEFGSEVLDVLEYLTKSPKETYDDYIKRLKGSTKALLVKYCDSMHNSDFTRYSLDSLNESIINKSNMYRKRAQGYLMLVLDNQSEL